MTEAEWMTAIDPMPMLNALDVGVSDRKARLFLAACVRDDWERITSTDVRQAIDLAERYADGLATRRELRSYTHVMLGRWEDLFDRSRHRGQYLRDELRVTALTLFAVRFDLVLRALTTQPHSSVYGRRLAEETKPVHLRDIFGPHPLRPTTPDSGWLTSTVAALAAGIYADRAFDRLPILADALEEAGCDNADVLSHCRGPGPHVRGCWVVDLVLGKS